MIDYVPIRVLLAQMRENWPEAVSIETDIICGVLRFNELIRLGTDRVLSEFTLTRSAFEILAALRTQPEPREMTPTELYRAVFLSSGGTTKVLNHLEGRGLIERAPNPGDGRGNLVKLTESGETLAEQCMSAVMKQDKKYFSAFCAETELIKLRDTIAEMMDKIESDR